MSEPVEEYFAEDLNQMDEEIETHIYAEDVLPSAKVPDDIAEEFPVYPAVLERLIAGDELSAWNLIESAGLDADAEGRVWSEARQEAAAKIFMQQNPDYQPNQENLNSIEKALRGRRWTAANLQSAWLEVQRERMRDATGQLDEFSDLSNSELEQTLAGVRAEMRRRQR